MGVGTERQALAEERAPDHIRDAATDLLRELTDIVGRYERALIESGWSASRAKLATFSAREAIAKAEGLS